MEARMANIKKWNSSLCSESVLISKDERTVSYNSKSALYSCPVALASTSSSACLAISIEEAPDHFSGFSFGIVSSEYYHLFSDDCENRFGEIIGSWGISNHIDNKSFSNIFSEGNYLSKYRSIRAGDVVRFELYCDEQLGQLYINKDFVTAFTLPSSNSNDYFIGCTLSNHSKISIITNHNEIQNHENPMKKSSSQRSVTSRSHNTTLTRPRSAGSTRRFQKNNMDVITRLVQSGINIPKSENLFQIYLGKTVAETMVESGLGSHSPTKNTKINSKSQTTRKKLSTSAGNISYQRSFDVEDFKSDLDNFDNSEEFKEGINNKKLHNTHSQTTRILRENKNTDRKTDQSSNYRSDFGLKSGFGSGSEAGARAEAVHSSGYKSRLHHAISEAENQSSASSFDMDLVAHSEQLQLRLALPKDKYLHVFDEPLAEIEMRDDVEHRSKPSKSDSAHGPYQSQQTSDQNGGHPSMEQTDRKVGRSMGIGGWMREEGNRNEAESKGQFTSYSGKKGDEPDRKGVVDYDFGSPVFKNKYPIRPGGLYTHSVEDVTDITASSSRNILFDRTITTTQPDQSSGPLFDSEGNNKNKKKKKTKRPKSAGYVRHKTQPADDNNESVTPLVTAESRSGGARKTSKDVKGTSGGSQGVQPVWVYDANTGRRQQRVRVGQGHEHLTGVQDVDVPVPKGRDSTGDHLLGNQQQTRVQRDESTLAAGAQYLPLYEDMAALDILFTLEHCCDCKSHASLRHDEHHYISEAEALLLDLASWLYSPDNFRPYARVGVARLHRSDMASKKSTKNAVMRVNEDQGIADRCGAFEVQVAYKHPQAGVVVECLHSKIKTLSWPSKSVLRKRLLSFLQRHFVQGAILPIPSLFPYNCACEEPEMCPHGCRASSHSLPLELRYQDRAQRSLEAVAYPEFKITNMKGQIVLISQHEANKPYFPLITAVVTYCYDAAQKYSCCKYRLKDSVEIFVQDCRNIPPTVKNIASLMINAKVIASHCDTTYDILCTYSNRGKIQVWEEKGVPENVLQPGRQEILSKSSQIQITAQENNYSRQSEIFPNENHKGDSCEYDYMAEDDEVTYPSFQSLSAIRAVTDTLEKLRLQLELRSQDIDDGYTSSPSIRSSNLQRMQQLHSPIDQSNSYRNDTTFIPGYQDDFYNEDNPNIFLDVEQDKDNQLIQQLPSHSRSSFSSNLTDFSVRKSSGNISSTEDKNESQEEGPWVLPPSVGYTETAVSSPSKSLVRNTTDDVKRLHILSTSNLFSKTEEESKTTVDSPGTTCETVSVLNTNKGSLNGVEGVKKAHSSSTGGFIRRQESIDYTDDFVAMNDEQVQGIDVNLTPEKITSRSAVQESRPSSIRNILDGQLVPSTDGQEFSSVRSTPISPNIIAGLSPRRGRMKKQSSLSSTTQSTTLGNPEYKTEGNNMEVKSGAEKSMALLKPVTLSPVTPEKIARQKQDGGDDSQRQFQSFARVHMDSSNFIDRKTEPSGSQEFADKHIDQRVAGDSYGLELRGDISEIRKQESAEDLEYGNDFEDESSPLRLQAMNDHNSQPDHYSQPADASIKNLSIFVNEEDSRRNEPCVDDKTTSVTTLQHVDTPKMKSFHSIFSSGTRVSASNLDALEESEDDGNIDDREEDDDRRLSNNKPFGQLNEEVFDVEEEEAYRKMMIQINENNNQKIDKKKKKGLYEVTSAPNHGDGNNGDGHNCEEEEGEDVQYAEDFDFEESGEVEDEGLIPFDQLPRPSDFHELRVLFQQHKGSIQTIARKSKENRLVHNIWNDLEEDSHTDVSMSCETADLESVI